MTNRPGWYRRLYERLLEWSGSPHGLTAIALVSFAEASFFPLPPDVLIIASVLARPSIWLRAAVVCSIASVAGGLLGYGIGIGLWGVADEFFYSYVPGFSPEAYERMAGIYQRWSFWAVFAAGFTPIPYKLFTVAAGVAQINIGVFVVASALSRSGRFLLVAGLLRWFGPRIRPILERHLAWFTLLFTVLLIGGFLALKALAH